MAKPKPADLLFWVLAAAAAAALTFFVLVLGGVVPLGSTDPRGGTGRRAHAAGGRSEARGPAAPSNRSCSGRHRSRARRRAQRTSRLRGSSPSSSRPTRGDCWLSARAGSETGRVLDERVLLQGESVSVRANRVWLSLGAASNVDVLVDQEPRPVPAGTVALVLTPGSTS